MDTTKAIDLVKRVPEVKKRIRGKEAGLTYNEYYISKAIHPQEGFIKKGFFKIKYFTKRFKANQPSHQSRNTGLRACAGEKERGN